MESNDNLKKKKNELYSVFIDFVDSEANDLDSNLKNLMKVIELHKILEKQKETELFVKLIITIANNHYHTSNLMTSIYLISHIYIIVVK